GPPIRAESCNLHPNPLFLRRTIMTGDSSCTTEALRLPADSTPRQSAEAGVLPMAPVAPSASRTPTLLSRVGKYALIVGALCGSIGAVDGILIGFILAPRNNAGAVIAALAFDRFSLLG